jgi:glycolate oxidase FAD binding subunit
MKLSIEALSARLASDLGAGSVECNPSSLASYAVDGKVPTLLCLPSAPEQASSILRICAEAQASVIPWGGGTSMALGNLPRRVDVVIRLEKLNSLIEHDAANLTATAEAGMRVGSFQENLRQRRQFLPVDPPHPSRATIGGVVAANSNGPRRMAHGGLRDLVIGMKMVLATGEQIKAGGKVVKNVAGYDVCKLFVGSLGTLGIITELTFRVAPLPERAASFFVSGSLEQCTCFVDKLHSSPLLPAAVTILSPDAAKAPGYSRQTTSVLTWVEGFEEAVTRHVRDLKEIARQLGLTSEEFRDESHQRLWEEIENFGMNGEGILYRITTPSGSVADVLSVVNQWGMSEKPIRYIAHAATGTIWLLLDADPSSIEWFPRLAALAENHRGHAAIAAAPPGLKEGIDVWGQPPPSISLMREIKRQFDPHGILNPGRFLAYL